ncbi:MAG: response regulator [Synergistaceae bacterium]|nr:response regulator [Synergistaceae bacterium]MBQ3346417.1 response regulator [Synergistaceae bacterium]MBQ3398004.1 response regulator [Synergistaceae bacterium]MBQ3759612.1 response regulator [Synergistaceae bacterium]MBQ4400645.1 response regulator [Synergistaceae bacterium]
MKEKILYVSDRPSMGADMLVKTLGDSFEVMQVRSGDEVKHVPGIVLVNLAGLEDSGRVKSFTGAKVFLLGSQAEIDGSGITGAEGIAKPFNAAEVKAKLSALSGNAGEVQRTLLLVDDDAVMIRTLREGLSTSYKVLPANSGANALKILARAKPDLILLDYEMPEMNGPQVLEALRANAETAGIPVMFLTAKNDAESIGKIEALKTQGHMMKTLPLREIKAIIQSFFDGK